MAMQRKWMAIVGALALGALAQVAAAKKGAWRCSPRRPT